VPGAAAPPDAPLDLDALRGAFEQAVRRQMMSDVPYAVLLSGGLDSSLVAAVAARALPPSRRLHTFSVGLRGSPDLAAARRVAAHIGSEHHEVVFTVQEGLDALPEVVRHLETFDVTTIRAGTPMYLLSRAVRARGFKMVLSGEGSDEAFAGYLYFHRAPSREELHRETVDKLRDLHMYDCLRSNKAMAAFGVEARVPFLDARFLEAAMGFDPAAKLCRDAAGRPRMEKWALRAAIDAAERPYLPRDVLWRQKEQFSDGVGTRWIDTLRGAQGLVSDERLAGAAARWPYATPRTKEAYLYRELFEESFPHESAARTVPYGDTIACSTAAATRWDPSFQGMLDPSGRAVRGVHDDAYEALDEELKQEV
jgi:asparagine synthase (glutamine-hydrolysing)